MINSNKITNTKIGDDIHYYVNGTEDRGIVVKMNNEYVTVFKESTQQYDDIHINDTFFIKDILVNKEWDKMEDNERYDALTKIHAPSPRFISKPWEALPKEIKELLTKNNAIETSHKEGKDDDMNRVGTRNFDDSANKGAGGTEGWDEGQQPKEDEGTAGEKIEGQKPKGGETEARDAGHKTQGKKHKKQPIETNPETEPDKHGHGKRSESKEESIGHTRTTARVEDAGAAFTTAGGVAQAALDAKTEASLGTGASRQEAAFDKQQAKQEGRKLQGTKETDKKVSRGVKHLKAWQLWLDKREQEVLKDGVKPEPPYWHKVDDDNVARRSRQAERGGQTSSGQRTQARQSPNDEKMTKEGVKDSVTGDAAKKSFFEQWLEDKSNTERSIHGNAGREPNSGVNTNTGFDASEDYEGFSHSGVRPEQFKHERKKPKVTNKERINIGSTSPSNPSQGTGDGGNPHNTRQQNKDVKGRAVSGKDRK